MAIFLVLPPSLILFLLQFISPIPLISRIPIQRSLLLFMATHFAFDSCGALRVHFWYHVRLCGWGPQLATRRLLILTPSRLCVSRSRPYTDHLSKLPISLLSNSQAPHSAELQ